MKFSIAYIIILFAALSGCSSMHSPSYRTTQPKNPKQSTNYLDTSIELSLNKENKNNTRQNFQQNKLASRFQDTSVIELPALIASRDTNSLEITEVKIANFHQTAIAMFESALQEFDNQQFTECCTKFNTIAETFLPTDSLFFEAKFYESECKIVDNKVVDAKLLLEALYGDPDIPKSVLERVIVRLGQIQCLLKNPSEAKHYFDELKNKYPNSIYLKVANCNAISQPTK